MIRSIDLETFCDVEGILDRFTETLDENLDGPPLKERLKLGFEREQVGGYAYYNENEVTGVVLFGLTSRRIHMIYSEDSRAEEVDRELFNTAFQHLSEIGPFVRIAEPPYIPSNVMSLLSERGFQNFDRSHMSVERSTIEELDQPIIPQGFQFDTFDEHTKKDVARLMFTANVGHVDVDVFPEFFGTNEACELLIENIMNDRYGTYKAPYSKVLKKNGEIVGVCFLTITPEQAAYIPDVCIAPAHRRKGFGKTLLVFSFLEILKGEPEIQQIKLDVTLDNSALRIYQSLGFKDERKYTVHSWRA
ncbi:MAG: GNAT family N-acetyltransferase [Candidatus Thorarchaeota archaeon]